MNTINHFYYTQTNINIIEYDLYNTYKNQVVIQWTRIKKSLKKQANVVEFNNNKYKHHLIYINANKSSH